MYFLFYLRNLSANVAYNFLDPILSKRHASVFLLTTDWQTVIKILSQCFRAILDVSNCFISSSSPGTYLSVRIVDYPASVCVFFFFYAFSPEYASLSKVAKNVSFTFCLSSERFPFERLDITLANA